MFTRITDAFVIEQRLLEMAHTTDAKITAPALAYFAPCSIDDAARVLDALTTREVLTMEVDDDGNIAYDMPARQKLKLEAPRRPLRREVGTAVVPFRAPERVASPLLAGFLSVWIPGAGHLYAGRLLAAVMWFLVVGAGYALLLPGLILHLFAIASAASAAHQLNAGTRRMQLVAGTVY